MTFENKQLDKDRIFGLELTKGGDNVVDARWSEEGQLRKRRKGHRSIWHQNEIYVIGGWEQR